MAEATAALACWGGGFSAEFCCNTALGPQGNLGCWDNVFTFDRCCVAADTLPQQQALPSQPTAPVPIPLSQAPHSGYHCWGGDYTEEHCCDTVWGLNGFGGCWDEVHTYARCCSLESATRRQALCCNPLLDEGGRALCAAIDPAYAGRCPAAAADGSCEAALRGPSSALRFRASPFHAAGLYLWLDHPADDASACAAVGGERYAASVRIYKGMPQNLFAIFCLPAACADVALNNATLAAQFVDGIVSHHADLPADAIGAYHRAVAFKRLHFLPTAVLSLLMARAAAACAVFAVFAAATIVACYAPTPRGAVGHLCASLSLRNSMARLLARPSPKVDASADLARVLLTAVTVVGHVGMFTAWQGVHCPGDRDPSAGLAPALPSWLCRSMAVRWVNPGFAVLSGYLAGASAAHRSTSRARALAEGRKPRPGRWRDTPLRLFRQYVRQVPQFIARGALVDPLLTEAMWHSFYENSSMRLRTFPAHWLSEGLLAAPLLSAWGLRREAEGGPMRIFERFWRVKLLLLVPLGAVVERVPSRALAPAAVLAAAAAWGALPSGAEDVNDGFLSTAALSRAAAIGFALGAARPAFLGSASPSLLASLLALPAAALGACVATTAALSAQAEPHWSVEFVRGSLGIDGSSAALLLFSIGCCVSLGALGSEGAFSSLLLTWPATVLSRLSLGMMVNNYAVILIANMLLMDDRPLPGDVSVFLSWSILLWVLSALAAVVQWCTLESPAAAFVAEAASSTPPSA
eukprot:TRINITY_DN55738_c0_g1_i1.p1 TRINITY_DN55738_c0_g1~~TRINITY_DN55738_c0_g1_i1.p1  ORF type:complete len:750 (-),score=143.41 TRINITY_DN55738_c0_g1_i1:109-2358(-)